MIDTRNPARIAAPADNRTRRRRRRAMRTAEERFAWLMVTPSLLVLVLVGTVPLAALLVMGLYRVDLIGFRPDGFIGLENYREMLRDERFWTSVWTMLIYTFTSVFFQVVIGLALALALFRPVKGQGILRVALLLPMIPVGLTWRTLVLTPDYGIIDAFLQMFALGPYPWLTDPTWALASVIAIHTWQWTPFAFLVFTASLHAMPDDPFEAAVIDGASGWQRFRDITLPLLRPAIVVVIILRIMIAFRAFDAIYSATGGGPGTATEILNLYAYRISFTSLRLGYGAALGTVLLLLTLVISWLVFRLRQRS